MFASIARSTFPTRRALRTRVGVPLCCGVRIVARDPLHDARAPLSVLDHVELAPDSANSSPLIRTLIRAKTRTGRVLLVGRRSP